MSPVASDPQVSRALRVARIQRMRDRGMSMREIGEIEGVSGARIQALLTKPIGGSPEAAAERQARALRDAQVVAAWRRGGLTQTEIGEQHGLSRVQVSRILRAAREA